MDYEDGIKNWLYRRKINDTIIERFGVKCTDGKITIPVCDPDGKWLFNKYRRNPLVESTGMKYWYDKGNSATLFGAQFIKDEKVVVVTEGELDALVLWSHNIPAVTSTSGARTFKEEWAQMLADKQVYICYDNDPAGGAGAVHTLSMLPAAKVVLLPSITSIKDVSDYYAIGQDFRNLMLSAKNYVSVEAVREDKGARQGVLQATFFHDAWLEWYASEERKRALDSKKNEVTHDSPVDDYVARAKEVPLKTLLKVRGDGKTKCLFHAEKSASMHVYPDNHFYCYGCGKRGDVIDVVMELQSLDFKAAVKWLNKHY